MTSNERPPPEEHSDENTPDEPHEHDMRLHQVWIVLEQAAHEFHDQYPPRRWLGHYQEIWRRHSHDE